MTASIYLRRENLYQKLARIDRSATSITGAIWHIFPAEYHTNVKDIHFTYPADGDYHVSAALNNGTKLHIFSDRAAIKKPNATYWKRIPKEEATALVPMAMVPGFKPLPIVDYATADRASFPIMTMGMGRFEISDAIVPRAEDFVINCDGVDVGRTPNFVLLLVGNDIDPYPAQEFIGKRIFFDTYPKMFVGLFYGS
jgi:hypothetical protein